MRAIHGGKSKNDKIDSQKIVALLRGGLIPMAYVCPQRMMSTRDLMRRRNHLMRKRVELFAHTQNTASQYTSRFPWAGSPCRRTGKGCWTGSRTPRCACPVPPI